ncbi:hypothetical protein SAMN05216388_102525 [Halorientalis persicus]|uniref:Uncharacterized protein n=1 Tax=Halorientalis persicus TaxID=1367881 RepID=A0A1H8U3L5_9EURY|nr:hypothetical protein [Halorientalis persicus]SEO97248.1 hypothetical protein SAMN05216388_102525 [Halorientalis persicus]
MPDFRTISGEDVQDGHVPPRDDQTGHTIKDVAWYIDQHTSEDWHVDKAGFRQPAKVKRICLLVRLVHESGTTVECLPIDPWGHHPGQKMYRAHRIVASGDHDELPAVVTPRSDLRQFTNETRFGHLPLPESLSEQTRTDPHTVLKFHDRDHVADIDQTIHENGGKHGRGYTVKDEKEAEICLLLVAQWLTSVYNAQETFGSLVAMPQELAD